MQNSIILAKDFNINKLTFGEIKKLDNGGKYIPVLYDGEPFDLQTPECFAPYGLNSYEKDDGKIDYSINLSFKDKESRKSLQKLFGCFTKIDQYNVEQAFENQLKWFKKKYASIDVVEALYTSLIKFSKDKDTGEPNDKYPPTFKIKIPTKNGKIICTTFDGNRNKAELLDMNMKKAKVTCIIRCSGIWVAGGKFGMSLNAKQMMVVPVETISGFCIRYNEEDMISVNKSKDDTNDDIDDVQPVIVKSNTTQNVDTIESSDDEDDEDDDEDDEDDVDKKDNSSDIDETEETKEPEPEPEPVIVKKKVVRKKKT